MYTQILIRHVGRQSTDLYSRLGLKEQLSRASRELRRTLASFCTETSLNNIDGQEKPSSNTTVGYTMCLNQDSRHTLPTRGVGGADWTAPCPARGRSGTGQPGSHQRWVSPADRPAVLTAPGPGRPSATPPAQEPARRAPGWHRSERWHSLCSHLSRNAGEEQKE